jgi:hypothetical protein
VVSGRASLDSDQARRQYLEECNDIVAAKPATAHDRASLIDPVNLKYLLGDIQANYGNLLHGCISARPVRSPIVNDLKDLHMAREALVKNRTAARNRAKNLTLAVLKRHNREDQQTR